MVSAYFLDTSALVKRYITETGSAWIRQITDPGVNMNLFVVRYTRIEMMSAFARLLRESKITVTEQAVLIQALRYHWEHQYYVIDMDAVLLDSAENMTQKHPLRAGDSLQLAAAVRLLPVISSVMPGGLIFLSADDRLLKAAQAEGINADDPNQHL